MCSRFVTGTCHQLLDDDELGLGPSRCAQVFPHREAILVCPVTEHSADEKDGDVLFLHWLQVKEIVALEIKRQFTALERCRQELMNLGASRGQIQGPRACAFSRTVSHILAVRHIQDLETRWIHILRLHPQQRAGGPGQ